MICVMPRSPSPLTPDFGATAGDYGRHRRGFPDSLFERLAAHGVGRPGQQLVDLGTGTGTLARGFARGGCRVTGIDPAGALLEEARRLDAEAGVSVEYREGTAERTGLTVGFADVVSAGQCWHWFDRSAAAAECARILCGDGRIAIAHFDWIPVSGSVVEATEKLIEAHNPGWKFGGGLGLYPRWLADLADAGFREIETFSYDVDVSYPAEGWRGRVRASAGVGATLSPEAVQKFDRELADLLRDRFPGEHVATPHRVFAVMARAPRC